MSKQNELKPCPFCGGRAIFETVDSRRGGDCYIYCKCERCGAATKGVRAEYQDCRNFWENNEDTSAAAANKWNVRPEQPTSSDLQIEKIKKALSTIYKNTMEQLKALSEDVEIIKRSLAVEEEKEN